MAVESIEQSLLRHAGAWTEEDYLALGEAPVRIELADGVLVVSPMANLTHQFVMTALTIALSRSCPDPAWVVVAGANVRLWKDNVRIPDVVVLGAGERGLTVRASETLLVAEVTSPGNFRHDRITKHGEYAEAGIPFYVRVDLHLGVDELTATAFELVEGEYVEHAHAGDGVLRMTRPWPVEVDLRAAARG